MPTRHAICLVVDGLRASALGTYGNTTQVTPQMDALASRALVADWLWADSPRLEDYYRSVWQGTHAARPRVDAPGNQTSFLSRLERIGVRQTLVTDKSWLGKYATGQPFVDSLLFEDSTNDAATCLEETALAKFFAVAIERLQSWQEESADSNSLLWLHSRGMYGPWDAPIGMRAELLDEEDPPPAEYVMPPAPLRDVDDPDILLGHRVAYAAQVAVLDVCLGAFAQAVEEVFAERETLLILTSSRGFALGEHRAIGTDCVDLFSEQLHLPLLIYPLGNTTPLPRVGSLCQPADLGATLAEWLSGSTENSLRDGISLMPDLRGEPRDERQLAVTRGDGEERVVRTPAWLLRQVDAQHADLFSKPDDRWEHNDVSGLCPVVVDGMREELAKFEKCCDASKPLPLAPQGEELVIPSE